MERIIPKNSKMKIAVFKRLSMLDMLIICIMLVIAVLILLSNFTNRWLLLAAFLVFCVVMFIGEDEDRTYAEIGYLLRYCASRRTYLKGAKRGSTNELIPFKSIRENGIIEYDGYFGAIVEVGSIDFGLLDGEEQDRRISAFARVLNGLSQSSVIQLIKIDRPIKYDDVAVRLFQKIKAEQESGDKIKTAVLQSRLEQIDTVNNVMPLYRPCYYLALYEDRENVLLNQVDACRAGLDAAGLDSELLNARQAAVFFKYCYTRDFDEREADNVEVSELADYVKPNKVKFGLAGYTIDGVYAFTLAVKDYPLYVGNAWGSEIFNIDNTKAVLTIKPVDKSRAIKRIDRTVVESASRGAAKLSEMRNQDTHIETMNALQSRLQNENELLFDCTLTVTGINHTKKDNAAFRKEIRRELTTNGFRMSYLLGRQFEGFAKSTVARRPKLKAFERGINSDSLAAVFPFVFSTVLDTEGYMLGSDYYPVILDIWKRGRDYVNSNGVIFGKSGQGKSFFSKDLLTLVYSGNSRIFILDPENEYQTLAKNVGGLFLDIGNATQGRINPLHIYPVLTDEGEIAAPDVIFNAHLQFLEDFFKITLKGIAQDSFEELNNLVRIMYENEGITHDTDCTNFAPERFPTFDALKAIVEKEMRKKDISAMRKTNLERVYTYVQKFAEGGMYSSLWNGPSTLEVDSKFVVFNFQSLFGSKNKTVANAQILVVMRYLDMQIINIRELNRNGSGEKIHPFILLDEGYNFIDADYPVALQFVYLWYKRIRKYEGSIFFATQNLSDIFGNESVIAKTTAIVNNSQYSFVFGLAPADLEILTNLYRNVGGLNDAERAFMSNAELGDCFAICSTRQRTRFHVEAHDTVRSLFELPGYVLGKKYEK